jgi:segregation and condensation protein A
MVLATVCGKPLEKLPEDLFIPPDALEILLDSFSGPLDILLYLIRKQNLDILDIPITQITRQYLQYIEWMEARRMELAADYLVMAAILTEIKSRLLLPRIPSENPEEELEADPRLALVKKLQLYEQFKEAAQKLDNLPRAERDFFYCMTSIANLENKSLPEVNLSILVELMQQLLSETQDQNSYQISTAPLTVRERMSLILQQLQEKKFLSLSQLIKNKEGRLGLAVTLLAILELARQSLLRITQITKNESIYLESIHYA